MNELLRLRISKLIYLMARPALWKALFRGVAPSLEHQGALQSIDCDLLLDVGANKGQFSLMAREIFPSLRIHAYEPLPSEAVVYGACFEGDPLVSLHQVALGEKMGSAVLHISRRADSSSLLKIGVLQADMFADTEEVGTCCVDVVTLDNLPEHWQNATRALLKIDVQGYELNVLRGARRALRTCAFVYVECSDIALYDQQALRGDVNRYLEEAGFVLQERFNPVYRNSELVQADYLYIKAASLYTG